MKTRSPLLVTPTAPATSRVVPPPVIREAKPILKYPGAKWQRAAWIIEQLPPYRTYVEPYAGSGAVFFSLPTPPEYAVLNDKDRQIVNLFTVLRTRGPELCALVELTPWSQQEYEDSYTLTGDPVEDARRFLVRCWQAHGTRTSSKTGWRNRGSADGGQTYSLWNQLPERLVIVIDRLKHAEIENRDALEVIARFADQPDCLLYVDPPYVLSTRSGKLYEHEMTDADHLALLLALKQHCGPVVLSGYAHPLYEDQLAGWRCVRTSARAEKGQARTEVLWINRAGQHQQLSLFADREESQS